MYHLYSGSGEVSDSSGIKRVIQVTAMISDILLTGNDQPVQITPGQPLPMVPNYYFRISNWHIAVDKIGIFFGQTGAIGLQFTGPKLPLFGTWQFDSDASNKYKWGGDINGTDQPNMWVNPSAPDYGHLPYKIKCTGVGLGQTINNLFIYVDNTGKQQTLGFVLQRI
jgi:hypothetical protein